MKNSNDTIGNQTRDLPTCSAVFIKAPTTKYHGNASGGNRTITRKRTDGQNVRQREIDGRGRSEKELFAITRTRKGSECSCQRSSSSDL